MDNAQIEGKLKMNSLHFSEFSFLNNSFSDNTKGKEKLDIGFKFEVRYEKLDENKISVKLKVLLADESECIKIEVTEVANFELTNGNLLDEDFKNTILKINTIAIMLPYLRAQVALLTTQPGMNSIQLPIIDASEIVRNFTVSDK